MQAIDIRNMERNEWLELRRQGIGGSDAGAILGMNPWKSPLSVYYDKIEESEDYDNERMRQGRDLEQYVADRFTEITGKKVRRVNRMLKHPDYPWMQANVDRMVVGEDAGLECKTTNAYNKTDYESGHVPPQYYWQCMHYMAVTGCSKWYLAVIILGVDFPEPILIERNEDHIRLLIERESEFWHEHVLKKEPPLPTGLACDDEIIAGIAANDGDDESIDLIGVKEVLAALPELERHANEAKQALEAAKQQIKLYMAEYTQGNTDRYRVTYRTINKKMLDGKRLLSERPDIYRQYSKTSSHRRLSIQEA